MTMYLTGYCYDQYDRVMNESCNIIVSNVSDGSFVIATTSSGNGYFNIPIESADRTFILTFYKEGTYGLDSNIAGACFMTTVSGV